MKNLSKLPINLQKALLTILVIFSSSILFGQADTCYMNNDTVKTSDAIFYDSGGENGNYSDNEDFIKVFIPSIPGDKMIFIFDLFSTEKDYDLFHIYDGPDTLSPEFPFSPYSGAWALTAKASEYNSSGAITFHFISDIAANEMGWKAKVLTTAGDTILTLTTDEAYQVLSTTAVSGGDIILDGGKPVIARGVCWSTSPNPTTSDFVTWNGSGAGGFISNIVGLSPNTTYYVRAYATNSSGITYGNEVSFTTEWAGYTEIEYISNLKYFHPTAGGSYPDSPYINQPYNKVQKFLSDGRRETWFGIWTQEKCWITINPDNSIVYEVSPTWPNTVIMGDPNDASKVSYFDPATGIIYLYYYYVGGSGNRIFWEVFTPPPPPSAPTGMTLGNAYIPFKVPLGTVVTTISAKDPDLNDLHSFELVNGYGDNSLFEIHYQNELSFVSDLNLSAPKDFNIKIKITDKTGLSGEFEAVIHSNTDKYEINNLNLIGSQSYVKELSVINQNVIWAETWDGTIGRTIDGGKNWSITSPIGTNIGAYGPLFALDSLNAWLVASYGEGVGIYKTSDGGESWLKQASAYNASSFPDIIYFWNQNEGFTMGDVDDQGYLETYTTINGGQTWERVPQSNLSPQMLGIYNSSSYFSVVKDTIWAVGYQGGYIFRSTDKGFTWEALTSPVKDVSGTIKFFDGKNGIFSPEGSNKTMYTSQDGGVTWNILFTNIGILQYRQIFYRIPGTNIVAMSNNNSLYFSSDMGKLWFKANYDFPRMNVINAFDDKTLWAGGWGYNQVLKINLFDLLPCQSDFTFTLNSSTGLVNLSSTSRNATNYYWDFGDGSFGTDANPEHTYSKAGVYNVGLTIKDGNTGCQSSTSKNILYFPSGVNYIQADFSYGTDSLMVNFSDLSTSNATDWYWTMGDGKVMKTQNPVYTYSKPGAYMVCLTAFDKINVLAESTCKEIRVGTESCIIGSDFSYFIDPLAREVDFSSLAKGVVDSYFWTFGDGGSSTEINPSHYFAIPGLYKISLAVRNSVGNCLDISTEYIQVGSVDCRAGFTFKVDANTNLVNYQDDSKGEISYYYWELGDGSFSVSKEVGHLYKKAGIYTVGQTVIDDVNGCMDYIVQPVQVGEVNCAADFMSYIDAATSTVYYTNKVMGEATALYWSFGDGKFSTLQNPVHQFVSEGFYSTGLNTYDFNSGCMDYYQETLMIGEMGIDCNADFIYSVDADNGNVLFSNTSIGDVVQWLWNFGDGSENSAEINPEHMYSKSGYYNVCLNIVNSSGTKNMGCKWVAVDVTSDNNCRANFMFTLDSSTRVVKFVDNSFGDIDKYTWDFGDSKADSVSADQNPSHSYSQKGYYLVQLKVEDNTSGCMSNEYKLLNVAESQVLKASFGYEAKDPDKKVTGYPVDLVSASSGDGATVEWDFGDKSVKKELFTVMDSTSRIVTHYYQKPGKYLVCLRITDPVSGQSDVLCKHVFTKNWTSMVDLESMQSITLDVFPNPFVDFTNFEYTLPQAQSVELAIFDQLGRRIETIAKTTMEPGVHQIVWESKSLRSGIYHVKLITKGSIVTKQLVITK